MKRLLHVSLLLCIAMLFNYAAQAQQSLIGHSYKLKVPHTLKESTIDGDTLSFKPKEIPERTKFTIVNKAGDNYVIKIWNWGNAKTLAKVRANKSVRKTMMNYSPTAIATKAEKNEAAAESFNFYYDSVEGNWQQRYFLISTGDLALFADTLEATNSPAVGAAILPFKYRPRTGEFTKDYSFAGLAGIKHKGIPFTHYWTSTDWNTLIGIGITSVTMDSSNTDGALKKSSDFAAVTISLGEVIEWKRLQFGVFIGWDKVQKSDRNNWQNQGKMWLGIGIGFSIFSESVPVKEGTNK